MSPLSSRARPCGRCGSSDGVVQHGLEDDVGQPALDAAHGLHGCFAFDLLALAVVPPGVAFAELNSSHGVQDAVDLPVLRPRQAMADLVASSGPRASDSAVSAPGPEPTSSMRRPGVGCTRSAKAPATGSYEAIR